MITTEELDEKIREHASELVRIKAQAEYAGGRNVAILAPAPREEPDNRIVVPIAKRAIDLTAGYLCKEGNVVYKGDGFTPELKEWLDGQDEGLATMAAMVAALTYGRAYEIHWMEKGTDQFQLAPTAQCIPIFDDKLRPTMIAFIRYWQVGKGWKAEYYDERERVEYEKKTTGGTWAETGRAPHSYGRVPVTEFVIAEDKSNLFDHVIALIDLLDKLLSEDVADEMAKHANAILALAERISDEQIDKLKRWRVLDDLPPPVGNSAAYITKNLSAEYVTEACNRVERLIYEMLNVPNPNDDSFATASGVAQLYKLLGFEYFCTRIIGYFSRGLQDRFKIKLSGQAGLRASGGFDGNTNITIEWKRNLPNDLEQTARIAAMLQGIVPQRSILELFPTTVIPDVEKAIEDLGDGIPNVLDEGSEGAGFDEPIAIEGAGTIAETAMNGAQVASLVEVISSVAQGLLPKGSAIRVLRIAFPSMSEEEAVAMVGPVEVSNERREPASGGE